MEISQASNFLSSCILLGLGCCVIGVVVVFLNNLFHTHWKTVKILKFTEYPPHMVVQDPVDTEVKK